MDITLKGELEVQGENEYLTSDEEPQNQTAHPARDKTLSCPG